MRGQTSFLKSALKLVPALALAIAVCIVPLAGHAQAPNQPPAPITEQPAPAPAAPGAPPTVPVVGSGQLPRDLSPWSMFQAADWMVKAVMVSLAFASLVTWTIWFAKAWELLRARR